MLSQAAKNLALATVEIAGIIRSRAARALLLTAVLLATAPAVYASRPIDVLRKSIDDGMRILNDPDCQPAGCAALQKERLRRVMYRDFDFAEFSRRVLAQKWTLFSEAQQSEFVDVFSRFLAEHYLSRLQQNYSNEKVLLHGQTIIAPGRAVVKSGVVWRNRELLIVQ